MKSFLKLPKWFKIFQFIDDNHKTDISKRSDITYSHVNKLLKELDRINFVKIAKVGRMKVVRLTESGKVFRNQVIRMENYLYK